MTAAPPPGWDPLRLTVVRFTPRDRREWTERCSELLSAEELERLSTIPEPDTRAQHAVGRALLRLAAGRAVGCAPSLVSLAVGENGKPWLPAAPDLHVNVAHAGRTVLMAATRAAPVGVDVERTCDAAADPGRLARRLFAASEVEDLRALAPADVPGWFTRAWVVKESVGKALGVGIVPALSRVVVRRVADGVALAAVCIGPPVEAWTLHQGTLRGGGERFAVAVPVPGVPLAPPEVLTLDAFRQAAGAGAVTAPRRADARGSRPAGRADTRPVRSASRAARSSSSPAG